MSKCYWVSCKWATCFVKVDDSNKVIETSNIWRKFTGQQLDKLLNWLKNYEISELNI